MFGFIKNWFKKEEEPEQYHYLDFQRGRINIEELEHIRRQEYLNKEFGQLYSTSGMFIETEITRHIKKCVDFNEIDLAITHIRILCSIYPQYNMCLERCLNLVKNSKEYKQMILKEKMNRIDDDFE